MSYNFDSYELTEKFDPNEGVGLKFNASFDGISGEQCITVPRTEYGLQVSSNVSTFVGTSPEAVHFYASLNVEGLYYYQLSDPTKSLQSSNVQPKNTQFFKVDIYVPAKKDVYSFCMGEDRLMAAKGEPTHQFDTIEECIEAIELEFNRLFGEPWILGSNSSDTWEEYKKELLSDYSEKVTYEEFKSSM